MSGWNSWSLAATSAPVKSFATRRPTMPALMAFSRTRAKPAPVGSKSTGITLPAATPSSTTSMNRTFGVRIENTWVRSTPGRKNVASVTLRSTSKNPGVNMSPSRAITAITTRSAPPNSSRYWRKVCMYSCSTGTSLVKPASTRRPVASHAIATVTSAKAASTRRRRAKRSFSIRAVMELPGMSVRQPRMSSRRPTAPHPGPPGRRAPSSRRERHRGDRACADG